MDAFALKIAIEVKNATFAYRRYKSSSRNFKTDLLRRSKSIIKKGDFLEAISDLSLEVRSGEVIGVIGRNGSGKSTLAKGLTGVLRPITGYVRTLGRVSSMIELTGGFNSDLTLAENVELFYLFQGMDKSLARKNLNSILEWASLEHYSDEPLHSLSSGMLARFAFSTHTSIVPDILILDEVLSVGDLEFQSKSFERMREILASGTTVVFISHDLGQVLNMAERVVWFEKGRIEKIGNPAEVISLYTQSFK
jgi:ABC-2 type transport system ATP-binding protein